MYALRKQVCWEQMAMKDAIDKRNEREWIAGRIVKRRNIIYTSQAELDRKKQEELDEQHRKNKEKAEQLVKQLKEDANKKQAMVVERLLVEQEMLKKQLETGMDATGKKPMDEVTQERVEAILSEKSKQLEDIISSSFVGVDPEDQPVEVSVPEGDEAGEAMAKASLEADGLPEGEADGASSQEMAAELDGLGTEGNLPVEE